MLHLLLVGLLLVHTDTTTAFKVAVYDQAELLKRPTSDIVMRDEALALLMLQLDIYEHIAINASSQGVVVMVFSEYGLMPLSLPRQKAYNFTEPVADPHSTRHIPCNDSVTTGIEVQRRLSCMAINYTMYITANMGERVTCNVATDPLCPSDGRYQFNTNVVFDPNGVIVARYRKYNLFLSEPPYNQPSTVDYSYFDTPYGRFGAIVCFDIIFREPSVSLIENFNISHVLFPTAWMNQLPYYSAVTFHQAFAIGLGVNLLASNLHFIPFNMLGSGIYGSDQTYAYRYDQSPDSALLVADIPAAPTVIHSQHPTHQSYDVTDAFDFEGPLFDDLFHFVRLPAPSGSVSVCHNSLCCLLNYSKPTTSEDAFALGAFKGLHTHEGQYYLEMCVLLKCRATENLPCAGDSTTSNTTFTFFNLTGNFTTKYVYPMVVSDGIDPSSGDWIYTGREIVSYGTRKPLVSSTMYGRRFDLDNINVDSTTTDDANGCSSIHVVFTLPLYFLTQAVILINV
jgi:pantetheine hydrolase